MMERVCHRCTDAQINCFRRELSKYCILEGSSGLPKPKIKFSKTNPLNFYLHSFSVHLWQLFLFGGERGRIIIFKVFNCCFQGPNNGLLNDSVKNRQKVLIF
jgi:hypothetical protein